jgi:hypothetical protein
MPTSKSGAIKMWKARKRRYDFCKRRMKKILSLSMEGWPRMAMNKDYLKWLDIVYEAKEKGLYSIKTANCDVISNIKNKAIELKQASKTKRK